MTTTNDKLWAKQAPARPAKAAAEAEPAKKAPAKKAAKK